MTLAKKLWIGIVVLIVLSPLGLILPAHFKAGSAWGEWGADEIHSLTGFIPQGLARISDLWKAPMPEYSFQGWENKGLAQLSLAYIVSAVLGIAAVAGIVFLIGKVLARKD